MLRFINREPKMKAFTGIIIFAFLAVCSCKCSPKITETSNESEVKHNFPIICSCGKEGRKMTVSARLCCTNLAKTNTTELTICKPCEKQFQGVDYCARFKQCKTCEIGVHKCTSCPSDRSGDYCETVKSNGSSIQMVKVPLGDSFPILKRHTREIDCPVPTKNMDTNEVLCTYYPDKVSCEQHCVWGYAFNEENNYRTIVCNKEDHEFAPYGFQECQPFVNCFVKLKLPGKIVCYSHMIEKPTYCEIMCHGHREKDETSAQKYTCREDGSWSPDLPFCAVKAKMNKMNSPPKL